MSASMVADNDIPLPCTCACHTCHTYPCTNKKTKAGSSSKKGNLDSSNYTSTWSTFLTTAAIMLVSSFGIDTTVLPTMESIPLGGRIKYFIDNWRVVTDNEWVLSVVEYGYQIPLKSVPVQKKIPKNPDVNESAFQVLVQEAIELKNKLAVTVVESCPGQYISSYFAVPKPRKVDQFRPILNLKYFNSYVKQDQQVYQMRQTILNYLELS